MSHRNEKFLSLLGKNLDNLSDDELKKIAKDILHDSLHGLCFSLYEDGQGPGYEISDAQILRRLKILKPYTKWIRTFSSLQEHAKITKFAKELGFKTLVGAWLSPNDDKNKEEINGLAELCNQGYVDVAAVGNEVIYRKELSEDQLIKYINYAKASINNTPVGYVDAYYEFRDRPKITDACDVILSNCYPFWEGCSAEYSLLYIKDMYQEALKAANGKRVIVTETGWPSEGSNLGGAYPSFKNYLKYFINAQLWSKSEDIEMFYFSSFDESWKVDSEGDVGAFWGIWDKEENLKF